MTLFDRSIDLWKQVPALLVLLAACDCGPGSGIGAPCTFPADCTEGTCISNRCAYPVDTGTDDAADSATDSNVQPDTAVIDTSISSITITTPPSTLDVTIGTPDSSLTFTVTAHLANGGTMTVPVATFETNNVSPGVIDGNGHYLANGTIGGAVTVTATVVAQNGTFTANASFNVRLVSTVGAGSGAGSPGAVFANAPVVSSNADAEVVYPLHGAVMPQNVQPADVQWVCSTAGASTTCPETDFFRVTVQKPNLLVTYYVRNDMATVNDHLLPGTTVWRAIAQTDPASDAEIRVDRWQAAMARVVTGVAVNVRFAQAAITGTVYYWDIDDRTIRAIADGTSTSTILLPNINSPAGPGADDTCVGCHSVSPSGRYMLANTHSANYGALYDLTRSDLSTAVPTPGEFTETTGIRWRLSSWSPDEDRAMVSTSEALDKLQLIDPTTGGVLPTFNAAGGALTLPSVGTMPAWARNDSAIAFVSGANSWAGNTTTGNLSMLAIVNSAMDRFGAVTSLIDSSNAVFTGKPEVQSFAGNHGVFYPTWSPNSQWIAFAHSTSSRSDPREANGNWSALDYAHTSALYLIRPNGTGVQRLTRGCAATMPELKPGANATTERRGLDFQPNFAPFQGGGYFWLSFLSRRPYGNTLSGNAASAIHPGQIWVMAVRIDANGNVDPSEVAYWLPGQNVTHRAVSAYWAPRPCRPNGAGCGVGSECCGGDCRPPNGGGDPVCSPPPPEMCRQIGQTCNTVADCCGYPVDQTLVCAGNVCEQVVIID